MKPQSSLINIWKSPVKGTFLSATLLTAISAFLAIVFYIDNNYSKSFTLLKKYYLSLNGITLGVLIPIYVGAMTATLVSISKKLINRVSLNNSLRDIVLKLLVFAYILVIFLGIITILYLGS